MLFSKLRVCASLLAATPFHPQWLLRFGPNKRDLVAPAQGLILDVGCATRWPEPLLAESCNYVSLDSPVTGGELYASTPDVFADAAALPFVSNSFDTVFFFEVLEHVTKPQKTLEEIARVLKSGGQLVMSMPFLYPMHDEPYDYQRYTIHGLVREVRASGLQVVEAKPSLNSAATAGLVACLALSGMLLEAIRKRRPSIIMAPLVVLLIPVINLISWFLGKTMPSWSALSAGHSLIATKP